jgi:cell division protein FtsQ
MVKKAKEKNRKKNTKEKSTLDLDHEIIIGIKTLPEPKISKKQKKQIEKESPKKKEENKKVSKKKDTKNTTTKKKSNPKNREEDEFELKLGIEDEQIKKKNTNKKKRTTTAKNTQNIHNAKNKVNTKKNNYVKSKKQQEKIARKRKMIFRIVKWTSLCAILIGGGIYFLLSPFFNIKTITVIGNSKLTEEEIISLSGIQLEENTFKIQTTKSQEKIKQNAYIDTVNVRRKLPNQITIEITERMPTFMITLGNAYVYMNNQGYLLEVSRKALQLPEITGFQTKEEDILPGKRLVAEDLQRLDQVLQIMKSAESNGIKDMITEINIENKQDYVLELKEEKKTVHLGDSSNLSTKMLYVISIIEENKGIEGEILVNTDLNNKGAIFRKKV